MVKVFIFGWRRFHIPFRCIQYTCFHYILFGFYSRICTTFYFNKYTQKFERKKEKKTLLIAYKSWAIFNFFLIYFYRLLSQRKKWSLEYTQKNFDFYNLIFFFFQHEVKHLTASTPKWNRLAITRTKHNDTAANVEFGVE